MFSWCWTRPSPQDQKACVDKAVVFNYDCKYKGATAKLASSLKEDKELFEAGFLLNHARILVGSGLETYEKGKNALQTWRHFQMNWTFVNTTTPIRSGVKFCVCVKEFLPWLMMPLQVVYVNENKNVEKLKASFSFGSGTLQGHLLAGEERFSVEMDENDQVCSKCRWFLIQMYYSMEKSGSISKVWPFGKCSPTRPANGSKGTTFSITNCIVGGLS